MVTENRELGIGSSDATRIMKGEWLALYNEKKGITPREDLSNVFRVQLGTYTEPFHLDWLNNHMGYNIVARGERFSLENPVPMFCHLDGRLNTGVHVEVKHTNQFATLDSMMEWYAAQLHHVMYIMGTGECVFSFIAGNNEPSAHKIKRNADYIDQLLDLESKFWWHMVNDIPPTDIDEPLPVPELIIDDLKPYDMEQNNHWAMLAADYLETKELADRHNKAKTDIKKLVPSDASRAAGHGVTITRSKSGSLLFK